MYRLTSGYALSSTELLQLELANREEKETCFWVSPAFLSVVPVIDNSFRPDTLTSSCLNDAGATWPFSCTPEKISNASR